MLAEESNQKLLDDLRDRDKEIVTMKEKHAAVESELAKLQADSGQQIENLNTTLNELREESMARANQVSYIMLQC